MNSLLKEKNTQLSVAQLPIGSISEHKSAIYLRAQFATRYSNVHFLHITKDSDISIMESTQITTCPLSMNAKFAFILQLVRNPYIPILDVTNCDFRFSRHVWNIYNLWNASHILARYKSADRRERAIRLPWNGRKRNASLTTRALN